MAYGTDKYGDSLWESRGRRMQEKRELRRERAAVLPALAGVAVLVWYVTQAEPMRTAGVVPLLAGLFLLIPWLYFYYERNHHVD